MQCYNEMAEVYDKLIYSDIDYKKWSSVILEHCKLHDVAMEDYLDLACGTGNLSYELCEYFTRTWVVDLSSEMLTRAESKIRHKCLNAKFICQDISRLQLNHSFDLITCCLDSTNYITEFDNLLDYFRGVYSHLKDNGIFIFDINSEYKLTNILGNNVFTYDDNDVVYIWENILEKDILEMYLTFFIKSGHTYNRFDEVHVERVYKDKDIREALISIGFDIVGIFDEYENIPISNKTERIVYVVKKKVV
ncbi:cypemycin methyltransferase [Clostridium tepidiprofundi DSM 19306]|uniref:Cypemycin methyltransferase n=1 Tax=Clostridium tepidiprofundi DSM 19306 TaxID=1121338 RepID=A0A151B6X8_9CLOT|nr:class I SAM-dependent methyltransferase [Clostridium tepidiprofundi]KYH35553.1 cypemycin methyltransferase [Clostridium tepidiprofundi DSM 19306]